MLEYRHNLITVILRSNMMLSNDDKWIIYVNAILYIVSVDVNKTYYIDQWYYNDVCLIQ